MLLTMIEFMVSGDVIMGVDLSYQTISGSHRCMHGERGVSMPHPSRCTIAGVCRQGHIVGWSVREGGAMTGGDRGSRTVAFSSEE